MTPDATASVASAALESSTPPGPGSVLFVGGGNMATAIIGGMRRQPPPAGQRPARIVVVDPSETQRSHLARGFDVEALPTLGEVPGPIDLVVWAVKPQHFTEAAENPIGNVFPQALHLSVMAGVRRTTIARSTRATRLVRAMPNTPALIGHGITGLYGGDHLEEADRLAVEQLLAPTGQTLWLAHESDLDAVTALSGSGPAYVFFLLESMMAAGEAMGLSPNVVRRLTLATAEGAVQQALRSTESMALLRQRVTSKGGTTHAAMTLLEDRAVAASIVDAIVAAQHRAGQLDLGRFEAPAAHPQLDG